MEINKLINRRLDEQETTLLAISRAKSNMARMNTFPKLVIAIESILAVAYIVSNISNVNMSFNYISYLVMYLLMIFINICILLLIKKIKNIENYSQVEKVEIMVIIYITFVMLWGSVVTLMDQRFYGKLTVYMVNVITCSVMYYFDYKKLSIPYSFSLLVLLIGLPFFQKSNDVLIGHYINIVIFMAIAWTASRILYSNYCENIKSNILLSKEAEGMRKKTEDLKIEHRYSHIKEYITVSIGVSTIKVSAREDIEVAIDQADKALYKAKNNGRNCVEKY